MAAFQAFTHFQCEQLARIHDPEPVDHRRSLKPTSEFRAHEHLRIWAWTSGLVQMTKEVLGGEQAKLRLHRHLALLACRWSTSGRKRLFDLSNIYDEVRDPAVPRLDKVVKSSGVALGGLNKC